MGIVGGAKQTFFLPREIRKEKRTPGAKAISFRCTERLRQFERRYHAGTIVGRAIEDLIAFQLWIQAQVIVVRRNYHHLIFEDRISTFNKGKDVLSFQLLVWLYH